MDKQSGARRGYTQGMGGKTVRSVYGQEGYSYGVFQDKKTFNRAEAERWKVGGKTKEEEAKEEDANEEEKKEEKAKGKQAGEWVVVRSKGKKKKARNGPNKLDPRYTLIDPKKRNYDLQHAPSVDVPLVRTEKKKFLVESETRNHRPDTVPFLGSGALKRGHY